MRILKIMIIIIIVIPSIKFENANRAKPIYLNCHDSNLPPIYPW